MNIKQRKIKIEPKTKLNYNINKYKQQYKLKDVSDLESFNAKLKPICRLQTVFLTETHISTRVRTGHRETGFKLRFFFHLKSLTFQNILNHVYKNISSLS